MYSARAISSVLGLVAEGFLGVEAIFPTAGAGLRYRLPLWSGERDRYTLAPGADVYVLANPFHGGGAQDLFGGGPATLGMFAGDVDLTWQHSFCERWGGECGIKLGAGPAHGNGWAVVPVVSLFSGWRF